MPGSYDNSVFINCPFDSRYRPLFEAVVFAVYDCGFYPRSALEMDDSSEVRIGKVIRMIAECRLAIHDISRTQLDRESRLPRFNMPLELGIFIGAKAFGGKDHRRKAAIVFDTDRFRYQKYISDTESGKRLGTQSSREAEQQRNGRVSSATLPLCFSA